MLFHDEAAELAPRFVRVPDRRCLGLLSLAG
jgi:hypothetical protein